MSCGVGCRSDSNLILLWHRPAATAPDPQNGNLHMLQVWPQKDKKTKKPQKTKKQKTFYFDWTSKSLKSTAEMLKSLLSPQFLVAVLFQALQSLTQNTHNLIFNQQIETLKQISEAPFLVTSLLPGILIHNFQSEQLPISSICVFCSLARLLCFACSLVSSVVESSFRHTARAIVRLIPYISKLSKIAFLYSFCPVLANSCFIWFSILFLDGLASISHTSMARANVKIYFQQSYMDYKVLGKY